MLAGTRRRLLLVALALVGCGLDVVGVAVSDDAGAPDAGLPEASPPPSDGATDATVTDAGVDASDAGPVPALYASSRSHLWKLDPTSNSFSTIGPWTGCGAGVEEVAVDSAGELLVTGIANDVLYRVSATTAQCSLVAEDDMPYALSFAPAGVSDGGAETLVGYAGNGDYVRIGRATGDVVVVRATALGSYRPSGDLVAAKGKGYLSATSLVLGVCLGDCLLEVDLATGLVVKELGEFPSTGIYGMAYWGGKVYGFANSGKVYVVTPDPFSVDATLDEPDSGVRWQGAGSTTRAP